MPTTDPKKRPQLLTWLCTSSFVFGILWIIMFLSVMLFDQAGAVSNRIFPGIAIEYLHAGYLFITAEIMLTAMGLFAVIMMWRMQKTGFYLYAAAKTVIYFLPVIFIGNNHLTFPGLITTSLLIFIYGILFTGKPLKS